MAISQIVFYCIAAFILTMGVLAVTAKHIFRAAIWLLFTLVGIAALYFWMEMEFIAAVQIVVYVGGIVVLIIFSIFLTQQSAKDMPSPSLGRRVAALLAVLLGAAFTGTLIYHAGFEATSAPFDNEVSRIGQSMLNTGNDGYALPFEVVSMLLLAAMVGCIVIAMREEKPKQKITPTIVSERTEQPVTELV